MVSKNLSVCLSVCLNKFRPQLSMDWRNSVYHVVPSVKKHTLGVLLYTNMLSQYVYDLIEKFSLNEAKLVHFLVFRCLWFLGVVILDPHCIILSFLPK